MRDFRSGPPSIGYKKALMDYLSTNPDDKEARFELSSMISPQQMSEIEGIDVVNDEKGNRIYRTKMRQTEKGRYGVNDNKIGQAYARL